MKTSKKVLSTFLALFMVVTMFSGSAFAADSANQLTGFGSDIASIGITGADVSSATLTTSASNNGNDNNMTYTYNVVLSAATSTVRLMNTNEEPVTLNQQAVTSVAAGQYFLNSSAEYTYINGVLSSDAATEYGAEISIAAGQKIQIITQNGTESPFITVLSAF